MPSEAAARKIQADAAPAPANDDRVEIAGETPLEEALKQAEGADSIAIRFAKFSDGRGFSLAAILRQRGYEGELVATGGVIPDQAGLLRRAGFDAFDPDGDGPQGRWSLPHPGDDTAYQPTRTSPSAFQRRAARAKQALVDQLNAAHADSAPDAILKAAADSFEGRIAMLSSFGAEAAVALAMLARSAPGVPVLFLDTDRHFAQTLSYKNALIERLGLKTVIDIRADADEAAEEDADQRLWQRDSLACCDLRKVRPLARAMNGYDALITGRKRYHGGERETLQPFEFDGETIKVNPFFAMTPEDVRAGFAALDLPAHPLVAEGYPSIGCWPCTAPAEDGRAGRWAGEDRNECGIHRPLGRGQATHRLL